MTKDELLHKASKLAEFSARGTDAYRDLLKFFESNVCIPKGKNRHPYANVLHEWVEGSSLQVLLDGKWSDYNCSLDYIRSFEYRIKPSGPVYEYQWLDFGSDGSAYIMSNAQHLTINEAHLLTSCSEIKRIEETKRERI